MEKFMDMQNELIQECNEEKEELEKSIENDYIPINEEYDLNKGYCYCMIDPTRPNWRKIGKSSKEKNILIKQYIPRYMPEGVNIIQWTAFTNSKLAEEHIFEKLKKYRVNNTEWFKFDSDNESIDDLVKKVFNEYDEFIKL